MIHEKKCIVMDIDGTICPVKKKDEEYIDIIPYPEIINKLKEYKGGGFYIILFTARNMRTHQGNIGKINANTGQFTMEWLNKHDIPFDEIHFGKPWQGRGGFYVDDKTIRPDEFLSKTYEEIQELLSNE